MRPTLIAHLRNCGFHRRNIELGATQFLAIVDKTLRNLVRQRAEHKVHCVLEKRSIGPHGSGPGNAFVAVRKQGWFGKSPLELPNNALRVAIDIRADLHHGCAAITAGKWHQIGAWHDPRNTH